MRAYWNGAAAGLLISAGLAAAQTVPTDVPPGHWAYAAIQDLASHGLVLGYPDGRFLGNRSLTRYEMAALVQRIVRSLDDRVDARSKEAEDRIKSSRPTPPTAEAPPPGVTPAELDEVRKLVDEYKVELTVMGTDLAKVQADIAALQQLKGDVQSLQATVGGIGEKVTTLDQDVTDLNKRVLISGYIQARYESLANQLGIYKPGAKPNGAFFIRRGRLKFTSVGDHADFIFQFGGEGQNAFTLRDAIVAWKYAPQVKGVPPRQLWLGQFSVPFGYEIEWSDANSFFPERSIAEGILFPAERDRGARFIYGITPKAWVDAAILNGGGINAPFTDDNFKDYTARVKGTPLKGWNVGVSGYWGHAPVGGIAATTATPGQLVFDQDTNGDGVINQLDTPSFVPGKPAVAGVPGYKAKRDRYGVDTQIALFGGTVLAEGYLGRQPNGPGALKPDNKIAGWYGAYAYPVTKLDQLAVRYDGYDPNRDAASDVSARWNAVWNHFVGKSLKLTLGYEWYPLAPKGMETTDKWLVQAQTAF